MCNKHFYCGYWLLARAGRARDSADPALADFECGARVYFVENRDIPMLDLSIDFAGGSGFDRAEKPGVASMTNHIMRLGAEGMDEDEIARKLADVGAHFRAFRFRPRGLRACARFRARPSA